MIALQGFRYALHRSCVLEAQFRRFACTACRHTEDADINAAKNILAAGLAVLAGQQAGQMDAEDTVQQDRPIRATARAKRQPPNAERLNA